MSDKDLSIKTSIAPWLSVQDVTTAANFYKAAFNVVETYWLEVPDGALVVQLSVDGAVFWLSTSAPENEDGTATPLGGTVRMILTVSNPDVLFAKALQAGATEIFPVGEEHGWRLGRVADPFGLQR